MSRSELQETIHAGRESGKLAAALARLGNYALHSTDDAHAVAALFVDWPRLLEPDQAGHKPLRSALGLFQQVETHDAFSTLAIAGLPHVRAVFDALRSRPPSHERTEDLLFATKILVLYHNPADLPRVAAAARDPDLEHDSLWSVIFQSIGEGYPLQNELIDVLSDPLPVGSAAVAYLDFVNAAAGESPLRHPFDTPAGAALLEAWFADGSSQSRARSAASTLSFLSETRREQLIKLGRHHPSIEVQLQAMFAAAKFGDRKAVEGLSQACLDPRVSATAVVFLENLGELNAIPVRAKNPDFMAVSEMCRWLAHPMEFGRPPDEATLLDTRALHWPPANEPRHLWLVRYVYRGVRPDGSDQASVGMVGSITFTLYDETAADLRPEDVYALHCCWELEVENDPRAPQARSIAAGRDLLRRAGNPGF